MFSPFIVSNSCLFIDYFSIRCFKSNTHLTITSYLNVGIRTSISKSVCENYKHTTNNQFRKEFSNIWFQTLLKNSS